MALTVPAILPDGDRARTRKSDPSTSHLAADVSQRHLHETKLHVLKVVSAHGPLVGSEINDLYVFMASRLGWRRVAWDSPRKRAGELAADGYLVVAGTRPVEGTSLEESIYELSPKGARVVTLGKTR